MCACCKAVPSPLPMDDHTDLRPSVLTCTRSGLSELSIPRSTMSMSSLMLARDVQSHAKVVASAAVI